MSAMARLGRRLEAAVLLSLAPLLRWLTPRSRARSGALLGLLVYLCDRKHRRLAQQNIALALQLPPARARQIARGTFQHFGRVAAEVLALRSSLQPRAANSLRIEGWEHLARAHAQGRGVIVYSAHIGNWEIVAQQQALRGIPMDFIARPLDNPWLEQAFTRWREASGNRVLGKHGALRKALRTLKEGRSLAILIDQSVRTPPRLFVPFFGRAAATTPTLGVLAVRTGVPVVPVVSIPQADGGYLIRYEPPLEVAAEGDDQTRAEQFTLQATRLLERWIRETPASWLWLHDRWRWSPKPGETVLS